MTDRRVSFHMMMMALARLSGIAPEKFVEEIVNYEANEVYFNKMNEKQKALIAELKTIKI